MAIPRLPTQKAKEDEATGLARIISRTQPEPIVHAQPEPIAHTQPEPIAHA